MKLTKPQIRELIRICSAYANENSEFQSAGWFDTVPERKLEELGLVRSRIERRPFGGGGAIGGITMTIKLCDLTDEGWEICREILAA